MKIKKYCILLLILASVCLLSGFSQKKPVCIENSVEIILTDHDTVLFRVKIQDKYENYIGPDILFVLYCKPFNLSASTLAKWNIEPFNDNDMFCFEIEVSKLKGFTLHPVTVALYNKKAYNHNEYYLTK